MADIVVKLLNIQVQQSTMHAKYMKIRYKE